MTEEPPRLDVVRAGSGSSAQVDDALRAAEPRVHLLAASVLIEAGALDAAWEPLREVAGSADDPETRDAAGEQLLVLADRWNRLRRRHQAEQALRLAVTLVPARATPALALHLQRQGDSTEALALWERVLRVDSPQAEHYLHHGRLLEAQHRYRDAYTTYLRLLHELPTATNALTLAARLERVASKLPSPGWTRTFRIALLGSCVLDQLRDCLVAQAHATGLRLRVHAASLDPSNRVILDPESELYAFAPDVVIIALHRSRLFPELSPDPCLLPPGARRLAVEAGLARVRSLARALRERSAALVLLHNVVVPQRPLVGIRGPQEEERALFRDINRSLAQIVQTEYLNVRLVDEDAVQAWCGQAGATDPRHWLAASVPWSGNVLMQLAREHIRHLCAHRGLSRRCLVLDPDNTLWPGVVGEDGTPAVRLDRAAPHNAYLFFQHEVRELCARGVLLAVCSRNPLVASPAVFDSHPDMLLRSGNVAAMRVNSRPKSRNLGEISAELNLAPEALVFWDSDPVERARMRTELPQVLTPEVPADPARYRQALIELPVFESPLHGAGHDTLLTGRRRSPVR